MNGILFHFPISKNNINMFKFLMDYANKNKIILELNDNIKKNNKSYHF